MKLTILRWAEDDLMKGRQFYESREPGLGQYFLDCLSADIDSLRVFRPLLGRKSVSFQRTISDTFPYAIYFTVEGEIILIHAVLDCRRRPSWTARKLRSRDA